VEKKSTEGGRVRFVGDCDGKRGGKPAGGTRICGAQRDEEKRGRVLALQGLQCGKEKEGTKGT